MAKIGLVTILSILLNLFLTFWLINQYISDVYFQAYVNGTIGQYYPFIILTLGVGGGSGLGYLFLKRKHGDTGLIGKIQKSKNFKPVGPLSTAATTSTPKQILPAGAPPSPVSKHTVYAVPPLPKTSPAGSSRSSPTTTWAASGGKSPLESILSPKQDTAPKPNVPEIQPQRIEPSKPMPSPFSSSTENPPPQPLRSIGAPPTKLGSSWSPQQPSIGERRPESGPIFQKPGMDLGTKPEQSFTGFSTQSQNLQSTPVPSKWASPQDKTGTGQWSESGVKSIPPLPTKWSPPSISPAPQERGPPPQGFPRPGPMPARGPIPPPQGGPRPFVIQGPGGPPRPDQQRPIGPPRPIASPQPFRPDPNRPAPNIAGQPRPPQPAPRPAAPFGGPMPQPWTPGQVAEKKEPSGLGLGSAQPSSTASEDTAGKQGSDQKSGQEGSGGGEMDWDTALDTILKTLRKDRVGDTK
jgi:hypothetical protein